MATINNYLQEETNNLITRLDVFFAFSQEQFREGIEKLRDKGSLLPGEKVTDIGAGGYIPSKNVEMYIQGQKAIDKEYKKMKKDEKALDDYILYQLHNHEVFYTGDINTFCSDYMGDVPKERILAVYKTHAKSTHGCNK